MILVVDDDAGIRELFELALPSEGYRLAMATDGREALEFARRERPDLVLADVVLPHLDGVRLCQSYRAEGGTAPVILMSASRPAPDAMTVEE